MTIANKNNLGFDFESPAYRFGPLQTQANNCLCVPIVYGEARAAGNKIWQSKGTETFKALVCFAEGEINGFSDIRINDIPASNKTLLPGCSCSKYLGNGAQMIDSRVAGTSQTAKAKLVGGLKHTAYLAFTIKSGKKVASNYMDVSAVIKGKSVRVYSDNSAHTVEYSNNPIWCILDFLTCDSGCGISYDDIDIQSFVNAATYCDEEVVEGEGPRYSLNLILDARKTREDWINEMLITCRGYLVYNGGKIGVMIEQDRPVAKTFTPDDIIAGSEVFWTTPKEQKCDIFKLRYLDPDNRYARAYAVAEADEFLSDPPIVQEIVAFGVTNFKQASRLAWFYLNQANTCNKFISFNTTKTALDITPGDIITLESTFVGYAEIDPKKLLVVSMTESQEGQIQLVCREYNSDLYNDTLSSVDPVFNVVELDDILATPDDVQGLSSAQNFSSIELNWQLVSNSQAKYEIREGNSWVESKVIAQDLAGTNYTVLNVQKGKYQYWIKAVNEYGNYSDNAGLSTIVVNDIPEINTIVHENILDDDLSEGAFIDSCSSNNRVTIASTIKWEDLPDDKTWSESIADLAPSGYWEPSVKNTGIYTTKVYDLGAVLESIISINYNLNSIDGSNNCVAKWRYSDDNLVWSDWEVFSSGAKAFRYYQFEIVLNSPNSFYASISDFVVDVDVPDKEMYFPSEEILVATDGVAVAFEPSFVAIPALVANISDGTNGYCVVSSKSISSATVKAYDNTGTAITAKVDIRVKGY